MTQAELNALVDKFIRENAPEHQQELDRYRKQPTLRRAVELAATARDDEGKMYSHQRRLGDDVFAAARPVLLGLLKEFRACKSFDELYDVIWNATREVWRFGPLATYDTALRIGANLGLSPTAVYLHCGSLDGAKNLRLPKYRRRVSKEHLPPALRQKLTPDEVETFLCRYKDRLSPLL